MKNKSKMEYILEFIINYAYIFIVPLLSISVLYGYQYLTRGIEYFFNSKGKVRYSYLIFMAGIQFFISMLITWAVLMTFKSDFLTEYETLKVTCAILVGSAPFSILILVWVALGLEARKIMEKRYGDNFNHDEMFKHKKGKNGDNFNHDGRY